MHCRAIEQSMMINNSQNSSEISDQLEQLEGYEDSVLDPNQPFDNLPPSTPPVSSRPLPPTPNQNYFRSEEDEQLQLALQLSQQEQENADRLRKQEEEELEMILKLSLTEK